MSAAGQAAVQLTFNNHLNKKQVLTKRGLALIWHVSVQTVDPLSDNGPPSQTLYLLSILGYNHLFGL